jgi:hypothetical protein
MIKYVGISLHYRLDTYLHEITSDLIYYYEQWQDVQHNSHHGMTVERTCSHVSANS